jgi:tetratricopeptide (TPR) repeat protein
VFYQDIGRFSQSGSCFASSLGIFRDIVGADDLALAPLVIHLAWLYVETGRPGDVRRLQPEVWIDRLTQRDPESKFLPMLLETVAGVHALEGRFAVAQRIYKQDFDLLASRDATVSVEMASALNNFGFIQLRAGDHRDAAIHFSKALNLWLVLSPPDDLQVAMSRLGLAQTHIALGRYREAGELLSQVLPVFEHGYGPNSLRTEDVLTRYAHVLRRQKRRDEAEKLEERARLIRHASAADLSYKNVVNVSDVRKTGVQPKVPVPTGGDVHSSGEPMEWRVPLITRRITRRH